jgi:hypothetical protein
MPQAFQARYFALQLRLDDTHAFGPYGFHDTDNCGALLLLAGDFSAGANIVFGNNEDGLERTVSMAVVPSSNVDASNAFSELPASSLSQDRLSDGAWVTVVLVDLRIIDVLPLKFRAEELP